MHDVKFICLKLCNPNVGLNIFLGVVTKIPLLTVNINVLCKVNLEILKRISKM